jgi:hypothetical protein
MPGKNIHTGKERDQYPWYLPAPSDRTPAALKNGNNPDQIM